MAPDEHTRHEVQNRLAEAIGPEAASYLMTHLPPDEWPHLATKSDLEGAVGALRADMEHGFRLVSVQSRAFQDAVLLRFEVADANMRTTVADLGSAIRKEMIAQTRTMIVALATIMVALVAAFIAAR